MKIKRTRNQGELIIYSGQNSRVELRTDANRETIWARQEQIATLFSIDRTVVTKHINNILKDEEVDNISNVQKMHIPNSDKPVAFYSLDIILSVGYRTNSAKAIKFRQWATKVLRKYLTSGFALDTGNIEKISRGFTDLRKAVDFIESRARGRVKGTVVLKLKKELI